MAKPIETVFRDFSTDGNPATAAHEPIKSDIRDLHNAHLMNLTGATSGAIVKESLSDLNGDLDYDADVMAWVVGDSTQGNDGVYQKQGASGAGSWTRLKDLPYNVIQLNNADAGTANAIQATTAVNVPDAAYGALLLLNITAANTGAVTLSVNSETAKPVVTNTNAAITSGYFRVGMAALCVDDGTSYRLMSYGDASAVQAAAEAAQAAAEAAAASVSSSSAFAFSFAKTPSADGSTDDVAALIALEAGAEEVIRLKNATYFIGTNYTPAKTLVFSSNTRFLIDDGVTVDFSNFQPVIRSGKRQKFEFDGTGTGVVSGLDLVKVGWFAGDKLGTTNDALAELQKAYDACNIGAKVQWSRGSYYITGATAISVTKGQKTHGFGALNSNLFISSSVTNGFHVTTNQEAEFYSMRVYGTFVGIPTSGVGLKAEKKVYLQHFTTDYCYIGLQCLDGASVTGGSNFEILDSLVCGVWLQDVIEVFFDSYVIAAPYDYVTLTNISGTFTDGEVVLGDDAAPFALGELATLITSTIARVKLSHKDFVVGETITGQTSGATAEVASISKTHQFGAMRLQDMVEGCAFSHFDHIGGISALACDATVNSVSQRPALSQFTDGYFDSGDLGAVLNNTSGLYFSGVNFSNRPGPGIQVTNSIGLQLVNCGFRNCGSYGMQMGNGADFFASNCVVAGANGQDGGYAGIKILSGANGVINGGSSGGDEGYLNVNGASAVATYGVEVDSGGHVDVMGMRLSTNVTAPVNDNSTTSTFKDCPGYNDLNSTTNALVGTSPATITAGNRPTTAYISGGTVTGISVNGNTIFVSTDKTVEIPPRKSIVVTHSGGVYQTLDLH
jgi:hypothetical protein